MPSSRATKSINLRGWGKIPLAQFDFSRRSQTLRTIPLCPDTWQAWRARYAASYVRAPDAPRHTRVWEWFAALKPGVRPRPLVEIWPRGGAKSTTIELGTAYAGHAGRRKFALYVSETQAQADKHLQSVAAILEQAGIPRAVNVYNNSKGWTQRLLRTANSFNVVSLGLDAASRGVKLEEYRPDLIIFDDVDGRHDTPETKQKKVETITETVIPSGASDCAIVFVQNLVYGNSIASDLATGQADWLLDRLPVTIEPAARGLEYHQEAQPDGTYRYRVTGGVPTWDGQGLATIERQINDWGARAFEREAQQNVERGAGQYFRWWSEAIHVADVPLPIPASWRIWCALDYGLSHQLAFGIFARDPATDIIYVLREHVAADMLLGQHVEAMDAQLADCGIAHERVDVTVAGHDCWAGRDTGKRQPESIADRFAAAGWPLIKATVDRVNGWSAIAERIGQPPGIRSTLIIDRSCVKTIAVIPALTKDPKRPDDVLKVAGDDPGDMLRYGVMVWPARPRGANLIGFV